MRFDRVPQKAPHRVAVHFPANWPLNERNYRRFSINAALPQWPSGMGLTKRHIYIASWLVHTRTHTCTHTHRALSVEHGIAFNAKQRPSAFLLMGQRTGDIDSISFELRKYGIFHKHFCSAIAVYSRQAANVQWMNPVHAAPHPTISQKLHKPMANRVVLRNVPFPISFAHLHPPTWYDLHLNCLHMYDWI